MKKALVLVVLLFVIFLGEILMFDNNTHAQDTKTFVAVTSYPLYEITNTLIGSEIEVTKLLPYGVEAHTYMPSVKTMSAILQAKLFIYNGLGMEPWIKQDYKNAFDMSTLVSLNNTKGNDEHTHHSHGQSDPHYWLDIHNMIKMTEGISKKLIVLFPEHKVLVENNAQTYIQSLNELESEYSKTLHICQKNEIVVNHNAFGYLAASYNFEVHSLTGLSPDEQVSAKSMKDITSLVKEEGINTIFFESFVSDKLAQTISKETGAKVASLQPLANVTKEEANKGYIYLMQENLKKLASAMECK